MTQQRHNGTDVRTLNDKPVYMPESVPGLFEEATNLKLIQEMRKLKPDDVPSHFKGSHGEDITLVSSEKSKNNERIVWSDGTVETRGRNGSVKFEYPDGRGFDGSWTKDGGWEERHWGPQRVDNSVRTYWNDGTIRVTSKDGSSGYVVRTCDERSEVHHWGPTFDENYEAVLQDCLETRTYSDGSKWVARR